MAQAAGIRVPRACLVFDGERRHFAVERFDRYRKEDGTIARRHVQTLSALLHLRASEHQLDYTHFMRLTRTLCSQVDAVECFRRTIFNLLALNRDDHGRNHAFVYDDVSRQWSLSPAYDLNPSVANVLISLSWFESDVIPKRFSEIVRYAELGGISRSHARDIFCEVEDAVNQWPKIAAQYGVPKGTADIWAKEIAAQTKELRADVNPPAGAASGRRTKRTGSASQRIS
jgi:serine/threonine-protein kinase HipA